MKEHLKVALIMAACLSANVTVASPMNIVGSSTVYPFSKLVADVLTTKGVIAAPKFSVTGSGKGIQLFCDSNSSQSPDITNASRRIKISELKRCQDHGVHVSEMMIGYDGIVIAGSLNSIPMKLSRKDLFLALAQQVPNVLNNGLIPNPYIYWDDLNPNLAHRIIRIIGSPKGTGTRDTFEQKVMHVVSREIPLYSKNNLYKYHEFRQDGVFISDGEDHERSIKVIESDMNALAIFGYHFFHKNKNDLKVATVDGFSPTPSNISNMNYPLARPLYFYFKKDHLKNVNDMTPYIQAMLSDAMIGENGLCISKGLVPLPSSLRTGYRTWFKYGFNLSQEELNIQP